MHSHRSFPAARAGVVALAVLGCFGVAACGSSSVPAGDGRAAGSAAESGVASSPAPAESALPSGATWLYDVPHEAARASGEATEARLSGDDSGALYANSTTQWLGCDGVADKTTYSLAGNYGQLIGRIALRDGVPEGIVATVDVATNRGIVSRMRVEADGGAPLQLSLDGVRSLTFSASLAGGTCRAADESYLVFAGTYVQ
jgi:hypothetical protein